MNKDNKKIVVFGGAFNPPHLGHAVAIENTLRLFNCDELWVMPSNERTDKKIGVSGSKRLAMIKLLVDEVLPDSRKKIKISDLEVKMNTPSITNRTRKILEKKYPNYDFYFLVGCELLQEIPDKWTEGKDFFNKSKIIAIKRTQTELPKFLPSNVTILNGQEIIFKISSTFIRKLIKNGFPALPYLTLNVWKFIKRKNLYG